MVQAASRTPADWNVKTSNYSYLERNWVRTPNFRSMPRRDLPTNGYSHYHEKGSQDFFSGASITNLSTGSTSWYPGYAPGYVYSGWDIYNEWRNHTFSTTYAEVSAELEDAVKRKILAKLAASKTNALVMAAEAKKTAKTVEGACERVFSAYMAVRRGQFKVAARILDISPKSAHKNWLEYKYGWMPILMDVKGTAELFAQQWEMGGRRPMFVVNAVGERKLSAPKQTQYTPFGGGTTKATRTVKFEFTQFRHMKVWVEVMSQSLTAAQQAGLTNPALVAWELVPYSFVFDWFYSVGNYLEAKTATQGLTIKKTMSSVVNTYDYDRTDPPTSVVSGGQRYDNGAYHVKSSTREYVRSTMTSLDDPPLPRLKNPFPDFQKMLTSLALMRGQAQRAFR